MIGREIRALRSQRGLSQQQVADMCGIARGAVAAIESTRNYPSLKTLEALAAGLNVTIVITATETYIETES